MAVIIRTKLSEMRKSLILFGFHQVFHTDSAAARLMSGACGCRLRGWRASAVFSCACAAGCGGCGYMLRWPWFVFSRAVFRGWPRVFLGGVAPFLILYPQQTVPRPTHHRDFSTWAKAPLPRRVAACRVALCGPSADTSRAKHLRAERSGARYACAGAGGVAAQCLDAAWRDGHGVAQAGQGVGMALAPGGRPGRRLPGRGIWSRTR